MLKYCKKGENVNIYWTVNVGDETASGREGRATHLIMTCVLYLHGIIAVLIG